jgi:hypothetical protein
MRRRAAWRTALATAAAAADADLAGAEHAERHRGIGVVEAVDVDRRDVAVDGHVVHRKDRVHDAAVARVDERPLGNAIRSSPHDGLADSVRRCLIGSAGGVCLRGSPGLSFLEHRMQHAPDHSVECSFAGIIVAGVDQ